MFEADPTDRTGLVSNYKFDAASLIRTDHGPVSRPPALLPLPLPRRLFSCAASASSGAATLLRALPAAPDCGSLAQRAPAPRQRLPRPPQMSTRDSAQPTRNELYLQADAPLWQYSDAPLAEASGRPVAPPQPGSGGYAMHLGDRQVLIAKDFQDFPSEEVTVEFWMLSTGPTCPAPPQRAAGIA